MSNNQPVQLNIVTETPSSDYLIYSAVTASLNQSTNEAGQGHDLGTKTIRLLVPAGNSVRITTSFTVDDWGYIKIYPVDENDQRITELEYVLADMEYQSERRGPRGGHTRWGCENKVFVLPAGKYQIDISQTNQVLSSEYASINASFCSLDMRFVYKTAPSEVYPLHIDVNFTQNQCIQLDNRIKNGSYALSGYRFTGTATVLLSNFTTMSFNVQSGGWMAKASPWRQNAELREYVPNPASNYDETLWPDTCCPAMFGLLHSKDIEADNGEIPGYPITASSAFPEYIDGKPNPDALRTNLEVHSAEREGSDGCISAAGSVFTEQSAIFASFCSYMDHLERYGTAAALTVRYTCASMPNSLKKG